MTEPACRCDSPLPSLIATTPIAAWCAKLYGSATVQYHRRFDLHPQKFIKKINAPVISIGGIRAGGTGKTPATMLIAEFLQSLGAQVAILSRGYKRSDPAPRCVAPEEKIGWQHIGDEPAMIRDRLPGVWLGIGANRYRNARRLLDRIGPPAVFLLDDGFQHRSLHRDLDIVCIHEAILSDRLLPQGFLREPLQALSRAQIFFLIGSENRADRLHRLGSKLAEKFPASVQFVVTQKETGWVNLLSNEMTSGIPLEHPVAVCGIARPERFFNSIGSMGIRPCKQVAFPDHFHYTDYHFRSLRELYSQGLITTEKDAVRLRGLSGIPLERSWYLKIELKFTENESLHRFHHYIRNIDFPLLKGGIST